MSITAVQHIQDWRLRLEIDGLNCLLGSAAVACPPHHFSSLFRPDLAGIGQGRRIFAKRLDFPGAFAVKKAQ